jgi:soluble lytic murein transglycosylase-like protein
MIWKSIILVLLTGTILFQYHTSYYLIIPIKTNLVRNDEQTPIQKKLAYLNVPKDMWFEIERAVKFTTCPTINENVLISLIYSESGFKKKARSTKNYLGLMQIPYPIYTVDANITTGISILKEKLEITNGDIKEAIVLYKGYKNDRQRGLQKADEVIRTSTQLERRFDDV